MFDQVLREPILFSWVTDQIQKDREERADLIKNVFESAKPWLNTELYLELEKKRATQENKIKSIAGVNDIKQVQTENAFDKFMKNLGIQNEDTNG